MATALVTGAAGGIGAAIVSRLSANGWSVAAGDLDAGGTAPAERGQIQWRQLDVRDPVSVTSFVEWGAAHDDLAGVVNCAGILRSAPVEQLADEDIELMLDVNLVGTVRVCRAALPRLRPNASIVNIGSIAGSSGIEGTSGYAASKAGVEGYTRVLACELAPRAIRANVIAPGFIRVPMSESMKRVAGGGEETASAQVPMTRMGEAGEIADVVAYLLSSASSYITGTVVIADGGVLAK